MVVVFVVDILAWIRMSGSCPLLRRTHEFNAWECQRQGVPPCHPNSNMAQKTTPWKRTLLLGNRVIGGVDLGSYLAPASSIAGAGVDFFIPSFVF